MEVGKELQELHSKTVHHLAELQPFALPSSTGRGVRPSAGNVLQSAGCVAALLLCAAASLGTQGDRDFWQTACNRCLHISSVTPSSDTVNLQKIHLACPLQEAVAAQFAHSTALIVFAQSQSCSRLAFADDGMNLANTCHPRPLCRCHRLL